MPRYRPRSRRNPEFDADARVRINRFVAWFERIHTILLDTIHKPGSPWREKQFDGFLSYLQMVQSKPGKTLGDRARTILANRYPDVAASVSDEALADVLRDPLTYEERINPHARTEDGDYIRPSDPSVVYSEPAEGLMWPDFYDNAGEERGRLIRVLLRLDQDGFTLEEARAALTILQEQGISVEFSYDGRWFLVLDTLDSLAERYPNQGIAISLANNVKLVVSSKKVDDSAYEVILRDDKLVDLLREQKAIATLPDNVVYRYEGTNDTVAGASGRGFYVASLRPDQLAAESAALGLCVGDPKKRYKRDLIAGRIEIFSIRTEAGESKFCIERLVPGEAWLDEENDKWIRKFVSSDIPQVKGVANRLPGFEPGAWVLTKPDEVRLVVEFLQALGYKDETIKEMVDIGPGTLAMLENGINPFIPPPKRQRAMLSPEEREERRLAAMRRRGAAENPGLVPSPQTAAMIREDYAHPWGGRWGT